MCWKHRCCYVKDDCVILQVLDAKKDEVLRCLLQNGVHDKVRAIAGVVVQFYGPSGPVVLLLLLGLLQVLKMVEDLLECEHRGDDAGSVGVDLNGWVGVSVCGYAISKPWSSGVMLN